MNIFNCVFKKNTVVVIFLLFQVMISFSQSNYKVIYRHCVEYNSNKTIRDSTGVEAVLTGDFNHSNYNFAKKNIANRDTVKTKSFTEVLAGKKSETYASKMSNSIPVDSIGNMMFFDKRTDTFYVREKMSSEYIVCNEAKPTLGWRIVAEFKKVKRFTCQKATLSFRGRDYVAWYTTDIPLSDGPWKFKGLPGLVLEIASLDSQVKIYAEEIEYPVASTVPLFSNTGRQINLAEYIVCRKNALNEEMQKVQLIMENQQGIHKAMENGVVKRPTVTARFTLYGIEKSIN